MDSIRVLVADDHAAVRDGFCRLIDDEEDMKVVAKTSSGEQAVLLARRLKPDVAVVDVSMPGTNGIAASRLITSESPDTKVLMISAHYNESFVMESLRAGAAGYLLKLNPFSEVISAIRMIHGGKLVIEFRFAQQVLQMIDGGGHETGGGQLSARELEILHLVAKGVSNREISRQLVISQHTVETHIVNILRRLGTTSRSRAVVAAVKKGWLTTEDIT